jgi:hypothetical protein
VFRYIIALIALTVMLALPVVAQEGDGIKKAGPCAPTKDEVAPIKTFSIFVVNYVEKGDVVLALRVNEDGTASCHHVTVTGNDDFRKTVSTDVDAKLTAVELKEVREAFAKLEITTLKTVDLAEEPEKFIGIKATNGYQVAGYSCITGNYGEFTGKVAPFLATVDKIANRLK